MSKEPMNVPHIRNANIKANFNSWGTVIELAAEPNPVSLDVFIEDFYCLQHIDAKNLRGFWDHCYSLGMAKYRPDYPQPPYNVFFTGSDVVSNEVQQRRLGMLSMADVSHIVFEGSIFYNPVPTTEIRACIKMVIGRG
jgi:hypothetical protein